jgi:ribosomal protein S16
MRVRFKLVNHGCRNHPYWWIIVQPIRKKLGGRYLEKIGIWAPRKGKTVPR